MRRALLGAVVASLAGLGAGAVPASAQMPKDPAPDRGTAANRATSVTISNRTREQIDRVRISPTTQTEWGEDLLGDDVIAAGSRRAVRYSGTCLADVQIVFHNGSMEARRRIDVCDLGTIGIEAGWTLAPNLGSGRR